MQTCSLISRHGEARTAPTVAGRHRSRGQAAAEAFAIAKVDFWAAAHQEDTPGRSEAIRRLVELGLKAKGK